ncbi:MAG: hypothetical protein ACLQGV_03365 [Bryobacteraceae bacterium]
MGNYLASPSCSSFLGLDNVRSNDFAKINNPLAWQFAYDGLSTNISWYDAGMISAQDRNDSLVVDQFKKTPVCGNFVNYQSVAGKMRGDRARAASQIYGPNGGQATDVYFNTKPKIISRLQQSTLVHETLHNISGLYDDRPASVSTPISGDLNLENLMGLPAPPQCKKGKPCPCDNGNTHCITDAVLQNGCAGN